MKKLIVHIGYPKTATSTLQGGIFTTLHQKGFVNYLGQFIKDKDFDLGREIYTQGLVQKNRSIKDAIDLSVNKINLLSQERLTMPNFYVQKNYDHNTKINPLSYPCQLKKLFEKKTDEIKILVVLRNQKEIIYSTYVQLYDRLVGDNKFETWGKYLSNGFDKFNYLEVYDYYNILSKYKREFSKDNISILLFEDFINDRKKFLEKLAMVLEVDYNDLYNNFEELHLKRKGKKDNGYIRKIHRKTVFGNFMEKFRRLGFIDWLHTWIENYFGQYNIFTTYEKKIYNEFGKRENEILIPYPTSQQKQQIFKKFKFGNKKLGEEFEVSKRKLRKYQYI